MSPRVVIIGGGFAGLQCARALERVPVEVTLVDRHNHHLFQPLLYQVATAGLNPADIAVPIRGFVRSQKNLDVLLAEVSSLDLAARRAFFADGGTIGYDHLVLATGATHSYFGHPEWARFAPGLKTIEDALEIRRRVLTAFEEADREEDPARREALLTFVVVGGGPTGVELAGALSEIARHTLTSEFRRIDPRGARILLLEGLERVLPPYPEDLSAAARRQLVELGVEVRTGTMVTAIDAEGVEVGDTRIAARTVLWGAGVAASPLARALGAPLDKAGRVKVQPDLSVPGQAQVWVAGDLAAVESDGKPVPGVAQGAIQGGRHVARQIRTFTPRRGHQALSLHRQGPPLHHRPRPRGGAGGPLPRDGLPRLVHLALRSLALPGGLPQPAGGGDAVGLALPHLRARCAAHRRHGAAVAARRHRDRA